jgi:hypothetical protein
LSACDDFLWGYLKSKVYINNPHNIQELKASIRLEIANVEEDMLRRAMQNFEERLRECIQKKGRHLMDIIFGGNSEIININCIVLSLFLCN